MALAGGRSSILTGPITLHTRTAIYITEQMLPGVKFSVSKFNKQKQQQSGNQKDNDNDLNLIQCDGIGWC